MKSFRRIRLAPRNLNPCQRRGCGHGEVNHKIKGILHACRMPGCKCKRMRRKWQWITFDPAPYRYQDAA